MLNNICLAVAVLCCAMVGLANLGSGAPTSDSADSDNVSAYSLYQEALHKSLLFYEAQRSGELPADNRVEWRKSAMTNDKGDNNLDLTGGYHDAGDFIKFGFPMAWSMTMVAWGVIENTDIFKREGELQYALEAIKWGTDYFIKCHADDNVLYAQVGDAQYEHTQYWGPPQQYTGKRPAWKITAAAPGTDLACETAAAMAAASIVFECNGNASYANELLSHAKKLYTFGTTHLGFYTDSVPQAKGFYPSSSYYDEMGWAAMWLFRATKESNYLKDFEYYYSKYSLSKSAIFGWDNKHMGLQVLAAGVTGESAYFSQAQQNIDNVAKYQCALTPLGLLWCDEWGSNRWAANMAFLNMALASYSNSSSNANRMFAFGLSQLNYFLAIGDNHTQSFVVGIGQTAPTHCHHEAASTPNNANCSITSPCWDYAHTKKENPYVINGALVGGNLHSNDHSYTDDRDNCQTNEVSTDFNAGYQGALAFALAHSHI
eukprot:Nk52_evm40s1569 gene=Nk52_evmTU40s1569